MFPDSVGINGGYLYSFKSLLARAGILETQVTYQIRSAYSAFSKGKLLEWKKTRKQPGFNTQPANMRALAVWVQDVIVGFEPDLIICMDPSMLFMVNQDWNQCTLDRLRGGVYIIDSKPWVVMLPITALNTKMKQADIAKLNQGYTEKADFDEFNSDSEEDDTSDSDDDRERMEWHEPITVPYGRFVLDKDMEKVARLIARIPR